MQGSSPQMSGTVYWTPSRTTQGATLNAGHRPAALGMRVMSSGAMNSMPASRTPRWKSLLLAIRSIWPRPPVWNFVSASTAAPMYVGCMTMPFSSRKGLADVGRLLALVAQEVERAAQLRGGVLSDDHRARSEKRHHGDAGERQDQRSSSGRFVPPARWRAFDASIHHRLLPRVCGFRTRFPKTIESRYRGSLYPSIPVGRCVMRMRRARDRALGLQWRQKREGGGASWS